MAFLYHACQTLGIRITADGPFKVNIGSRDLERVKIRGLFSDVLGPYVQKMLEMAKLELKK